MIPTRSELTDQPKPKKWWQRFVSPFLFLASLVISNQKGVKGNAKNLEIVKEVRDIANGINDEL